MKVQGYGVLLVLGCFAGIVVAFYIATLIKHVFGS